MRTLPSARSICAAFVLDRIATRDRVGMPGSPQVEIDACDYAPQLTFAKVSAWWSEVRVLDSRGGFRRRLRAAGKRAREDARTAARAMASGQGAT